MKIRSVFAAMIGTLLLSESAFALSCAAPDLVKTLEDAKASEKLYHILVGNFVSVSPRPNNEPFGGYVSPEDQFKPKPPKITSAYFEGYSLAQSPRHDVPLARFPVDIETSCAGPWCSDVPSSDRELIAFVQARDGQTPLLKISPCPYWTFEANREQVQKIRQCLDRKCKPGNQDW